MECYSLPVSIYSSSSGQGSLSKLLVILLSPWVPASFYSLSSISAPHSFCCLVASHSSFRVWVCFCNSPPDAFSRPSHPGCIPPIPATQVTGSDQWPQLMAPLWGGTFSPAPWWESPHHNQLQAGRRCEGRACLPCLHDASFPRSSTPAPSSFPGWSSLQSLTTSHTERKERRGKKENKETSISIFRKLQLKTPLPPQRSHFS